MTHVIVERARPNGFNYLHEASIAFHGGRLHIGWANSPEEEKNTSNELYRTRVSDDGGFSWGEVGVLAPGGPTIAHNHGVMLERGDELWSFVARHDDESLSGMEAFQYVDDDEAWASRGVVLPGFIPFDTPKRLTNGNWIIAGETAFHNSAPAVAISDGDDLLSWRLVTLPLWEGAKLRFPEATVIPSVTSDRLLVVSRYEEMGTPWKDVTNDHPYLGFALASFSDDNGETWSTAEPSNLPMFPAKPCGGVLSTGQRFLVCNLTHPDKADNRRDTLVIYLSRSGDDRFSHVLRVRHGESPSHPFYANRQWSYPCAIEHDGKLYIAYTVNKSDCCLTSVPLTSLQVPAEA